MIYITFFLFATVYAKYFQALGGMEMDFYTWTHMSIRLKFIPWLFKFVVLQFPILEHMSSYHWPYTIKVYRVKTAFYMNHYQKKPFVYKHFLYLKFLKSKQCPVLTVCWFSFIFYWSFISSKSIFNVLHIVL